MFSIRLFFQNPLEKAQAAKNKGNKYFKAAKYDQAIKCYTEAIRICPPENKQEIARGGRYDDLLKSLGSKKNIPAVGAAINLNNLSKITQ